MHVPGKDNILADALSRLQVSPHLLAIFGMNQCQYMLIFNLTTSNP